MIVGEMLHLDPDYRGESCLMPQAMPFSPPEPSRNSPTSHSCLSSRTPSTSKGDVRHALGTDHTAARSTIPLVRVGNPVHMGNRVQPGRRPRLSFPVPIRGSPRRSGRRPQVLLHGSFRLVNP